jgi:hypothetical protein
VSDDREVDYHLEQMTGSRTLARELKENLRRLRDGAAGPELAEMAREVLEGRTTLREVARSAAYSEQMLGLADRLQEWNTGLTDEERDELVQETEQRLAEGDSQI